MATRKAASTTPTGPPAIYRPTVRARLHNVVWTVTIVACWPIAAILALIERLWAHE